MTNKIASAIAIIDWSEARKIPFADPVAGKAWVGASNLCEGETSGDIATGFTTMNNFCPPVAQCWPTPHMYHFLPGVASTIVSFPEIKASDKAGLMQFWNPVPLTLNTLWDPTG